MCFFSAFSDNALVPNVSIDDLKQMKVGVVFPDLELFNIWP